MTRFDKLFTRPASSGLLASAYSLNIEISAVRICRLPVAHHAHEPSERAQRHDQKHEHDQQQCKHRPDEREMLGIRRHDLSRQLAQPDQQPDTETEALLADIWLDVFELSEIRTDDDFFQLGGDSLVAAVVAARVHGALGVELNLGMFADHPTLTALAHVIDQLSRDTKSDKDPLVRVSRAAPLPLSFSQERTWLACQTPEGLRGYCNTNRYCILGPLDREILRDCMSHLVRRHESLRTTFESVDGRPVQVVHADDPVELPFYDFVGIPNAEQRAESIFQAQARRSFDLTRLPHMRFSLVRVRENEYWLQRALHHINSDAWSSQMYYRELALLYAARHSGEAPPLPDAQSIQYADYAAWERNSLRSDGPVFREAIDWWKNTLAERAPVLQLPCKRPAKPPEPPVSEFWKRLVSKFKSAAPPAPITPADGMIRWGLDPKISELLERLGRTEGATYFLTRLAAFVALLASETNQRDILVGTYVSNRNRLSLQSIYGPFVNLIALRFQFQPEKSFREWLSIVRDGTMAAEARGIVPFEMLCEELERDGLGRPPINVIFQVSQNRRSMEFADLKMIWMEQHFESMPWGFSMNPDEHAEQHNCRVSFDAHIYHPPAVRMLVDRYRRLLDVVSRHPDQAIDQLLAMSRSEGRVIH